MKKRYFAAVTAAALVTVPIPTDAALSDISKHPYEASIQALVKQGVINGYTNGTFRPENALKRWDVIVMLGRYLEKQGYKAPADYRSVMRFDDLHLNSGDTILKYAALLKEANIVQGYNNRLSTNDLLSREQTALLLVRLFSKLNGVDYTDHLIDDTYNDLFGLSNESVKSIQLFKAHNLLASQNFNPSQHTTRAEFAHFLYRFQQLGTISDLQVQAIQIITPSRLVVTLSDGVPYQVQLNQPLEDGENQNVRFTILGKQFQQTIQYRELLPLEVEAITNPNSTQFNIVFNKPVNLPTTMNDQDIRKLISISARDNQATPTIMRGELLADGKTLQVTVQSYASLQKRYTIRIQGIYAKTTNEVIDTSEIATFVVDKTAPIVESFTQTTSTSYTLKLSEPISSIYAYNATAKLKNGTAVYGITYTLTNNNKELIVNLANAYVNGKPLEKNIDVEITFPTLTDLAGNQLKNVVRTVSKRDIYNDLVPPKLLTVEQVGAKKIAFTFDEPMRLSSFPNLFLRDANGAFNLVDTTVQSSTNPNMYIVTFDDYLDGWTAIQTRTNAPLHDVTGNRLAINTSRMFTYNAKQPSLVYSEVVREGNIEYLHLYFDQAIALRSNSQIHVAGKFVSGNQTYTMNHRYQTFLLGDDSNPKLVKVMLQDLLVGSDREGAVYTVIAEFSHVTNDYGVAFTGVQEPIRFERSKDYQSNSLPLFVESVETSRTSNAITNSNEIHITFNTLVDPTSALVKDNYEYGNYVIEQINLNPNNGKQVILKLRENTISTLTSAYLYVENVQARGSFKTMESYYEAVNMYENMKPVVSTVAVSSNNTITVTFNEAMREPAKDAFVLRSGSGQLIGTTAAVHKENARQVIITADRAFTRNEKLTLTLRSNRSVSDLFYNPADFTERILYAPWSY